MAPSPTLNSASLYSWSPPPHITWMGAEACWFSTSRHRGATPPQSSVLTLREKPLQEWKPQCQFWSLAGTWKVYLHGKQHDPARWPAHVRAALDAVTGGQGARDSCCNASGKIDLKVLLQAPPPWRMLSLVQHTTVCPSFPSKHLNIADKST